MLKVKEGVRFVSSEAAMNVATMVVSEVCKEFGVDCVITCGKEEHKDPSKHLVGALDFRTYDLESQQHKEQFADAVSYRLGSGFYVLLEINHLHVQYPRKGVSA